MKQPARSDRLYASTCISRLDEVAATMERHWGIDRLPLLVDPDLRLRFDRQRAKLKQAIAADHAEAIVVQAEGMTRAWQALDRAAIAAGAESFKPEIWECRLPASGKVVAIVCTGAEARHVAKDRDCWSLAEIAVLIERLGDDVREVKATFPGATVIDVRPREFEELLDEIAKAFERYVIMPPACATALSLWTVHSHAFEASTITPRLQIKSPVKRCGKTTVLEILQLLVRRALMSASISAAAVFRTVEVARPTLLIDEADTFLAEAEELRGVLNSGHRQSGEVIRAVGVGDDFEPRRFSTWSPLAIAAIGKLPGALEDRSIQINLKRRTPTEKVERWRFDHAPRVLGPLVRQCARWVADHLDGLRNADPATPAQLHDRAADNWRPLLAIADLAGGEWPKRARAAAETLSAGAEDEGWSAMLLADLKGMFAVEDAGTKEPPEWLATKEIINKLTAMEERPWPTICRDKPINVQKLGSMLKAFGIYSKRHTDKNARGYAHADLADAWGRYACETPKEGANDPAIRPESRNGAASEQIRSGATTHAPAGSMFANSSAAARHPTGSPDRYPPDIDDDDDEIRI